MKKILLGTTALIGAAGLYASAASAATTPTVTVAGFLNFEAGFTSEDQDANRRDWQLANDTEVHFRVDGKADNGLGYGAVIELEADVSNDANAEGVNADKTYLYLQGGWGRVELGANSGPDQALQVDAGNIARATGGIDGDWYLFINPASAALGIVSSDLPIAHGAGTAAGIAGAAGATEDSNKIIYYTPRWSGWQFGLSFSPDANVNGTAASFVNDNVGGFENVWSGGINYNGKFQNVGVQASLTGEHGEAELAAVEDLQAWALGLGLSYQGWSLAGSYGDWSESGQAVAATNNDSDYWTLGLAYATGPYGASVTYLSAEYATTDTTLLSVGADYKLAPGLVPYVEVNVFDIDPTGTASDNDGTSVIIGSKLSF